MSGVSSRLMMAGELLDAVARELRGTYHGGHVSFYHERWQAVARKALEREREALKEIAGAMCEGCLAVQLAHDAECFLADRLEADAATLDFEGLRNAAADCREASVLLRHQEKALREVLDTDYFTSPLVAWNRCVEVAREALEAREEEKK